MLPWLQSNFNFPLSGNVNQKIEPDWFFGAIDSEVGDSEIEKEIFHKVASYGKQIGIIIDALISIGDQLEIDGKEISALEKLKELQKKVDSVKDEKKKRVRENARHILDKLKECDPEAFNKLLGEYRN